MRANVDAASKQAIADFKEGATALQQHLTKDRAHLCLNKGEVQQLAQVIFNEINVEHKGHSIA